MDSVADYDVIIIGGGPAGLSAALILARCCRRVLVIDEGKPRNRNAAKLHGFITRNGTPPDDFLALARDELAAYELVAYRQARAEEIREGDRFLTVTAGGSSYTGRRVLLATGVIDKWPAIVGAAPFFGRSIHHCPYCDAWEVRNQVLGVYGRGKPALKLALTLSIWTDQIRIFTDGGESLAGEERQIAERHGIAIYTSRIARLSGEEGKLDGVELEGGELVPVRALFFATDRYERLLLAEELGCDFNDDGCIRTAKHRMTSIANVYAAGDVTRDVQFVVMAASQGAQAATGINLSLLKEDLAAAGTSYPD